VVTGDPWPALRRRDAGVEHDVIDAAIALAALPEREAAAFRAAVLGRLAKRGTLLRVRPPMALLLEALEEYADGPAWALLAAQVDPDGRYADAIVHAGAHAARAHAALSRGLANRRQLPPGAAT
jgi:hypothetical protein